MRSSAATNRRRSLRNRRNRQPTTPPNQRIVFSPKIKYEKSSRRADGAIILSTRKRSLPTAEELEQRKKRKLEIKTAQVANSCLRHTVINLYEYGAFLEDRQFPPRSSRCIIQFLQQTYPEKYGKFAAAKSFVYRTIKKAKEAATTPHLNPFRERRGENRLQTKRKNPVIVELCDELFSEPGMTAPKAKRQLQSSGHRLSISTIRRVRIDLHYRWQKPWYTDVLTPAQKMKRKLFCQNLLQLTDADLLREIANWLFTDEKWWDIVGPAAYKYVKAESNAEGKMLNQVLFFFLFIFVCSCFLFMH